MNARVLRRRRFTVRRSAAISCVLIASGAQLVFAPQLPGQTQTKSVSQPAIAIVNILVGGLTSGAFSWSSGRSFLRGFGEGGIGGAVSFAGKKIISWDGPAAAWAGRQVSAVGSSLIRSAESGQPLFGNVVLPIGPIRLYVRLRNGLSVRPKIDAADVISIAVAARASESDFDLSATLHNGAVTFLEPVGFDKTPASQVAGVISVDNIPADTPRNGTKFSRVGLTSHELIHAAQYDFISITLNEPLERSLAEYVPRGRLIHRYVDFGLLVPPWLWLNRAIPHDIRPWEREAGSLASGF